MLSMKVNKMKIKKDEKSPQAVGFRNEKRQQFYIECLIGKIMIQFVGNKINLHISLSKNEKLACQNEKAFEIIKHLIFHLSPYPVIL